MEPDFNTSPQKSEIKYPEGYENWSMDDKQKFEDDIQKLESLGIKVEIVEAQMGLAMYDETEKTLRIRQDADAEFVADYIQNAIFKEQDGVDQLPDPGELEDIHIEEDEENQVFGGVEEVREEINTPEIVEIKEAADKNGEVIKIGDKVRWDFYGGSDNGEITSFVSRGNTVLANIYSDTAKELEINVGNIFLVKEPERVEINSEEERKDIEANYKPEWQKGLEWAEFERSRAERAKAEIANRKDESFGSFVNALGHGLGGLKKGRGKMTDSRNLRWDTQDDYNDQKNTIAKRIEETFRKNAGENLTPEQEVDLQSKINDKIFEELVQKENDAYLKSLKEARGETAMGKALESAKSLLGTKTMQWYLGLSKKERIACSFVIGTAAGLTFGAGIGALGAAGYVGKRVLTGAAGIGMGELVNKKKSWSLEEINRLEEAEKEELRNSSLSLEEKSEKELGIRKKYKKERLKATAWKAGLTFTAGAGTGFLANLAEGTFAGVGGGGAAKSALESKGGKAGGIAENRLQRKGFDPNQIKPPGPRPAEAVMPEPSAPRPVETIVSEKIFNKPEILIHEVKAGDSTWKILKGTLENNEQFKGMTEAQKTYVLSSLTNKVLQNPENYGLNKAGSLNIGDKTDFTKLFENTKEVNGVFAKAKETIMEGSAQEKSILLNNEKIAAWVEAHPNESLDEGRVTEILNSKPEVKVAPVPETVTEVPTEKSVIETPAVLEMSDTPAPEPEPAPQVESEPQPEANNVSEMLNEIEEAKKRLEVLEGGRGMRSMMGDISAEQGVEKAFRDEINSIYEQSGFLGLGKVPGINTKEWGEMARLPASKVVEYYTGDSAKSGLPNEILEKLTKSKNHNALMRQTAGLMEQANGAVKPFENENMEQFIKRLGGYVLRTYSQNLPKAA